MSKCIVVMGNLSDGFSFVGPFVDFDDATQWCENAKDNTWVASLVLSDNNDEPEYLSPETDYAIQNDDSVWITVGDKSVHVKHGDEGVSVTIYPLGAEEEDSIAETWAEFE